MLGKALVNFLKVRRNDDTQTTYSFGFVGLISNSKDLNFNKDILPILSDKCYACHGPDAHDIKGNLQLHTYESSTQERHYNSRSGKKRIVDPAIIPNPEKSLVWERIISDDEDELMPPPKHHKPLTEKENTFKKWIAEAQNMSRTGRTQK